MLSSTPHAPHQRSLRHALRLNEVWVRGDLSTRIQVLFRWGAVLGQATTLAFASYLGVAVPWLPCTLLLAFILLSNIALVWWLREVQHHLGDGFFHVAFLDILTLSAMLYWTGGMSNPFAVFLLIQLMLATLALRTAAMTSLSLLSAGACLCLWHHHHPLMMISGDPISAELLNGGRVAALLLAGLFIVTLLLTVRRRSHRLQNEQEKLRREVEAQDRFLSLATLATGFAHELATPIGTIALAAEELLHHDPRPETVSIVNSVQRSREILDRLRRLGQDTQTLGGDLQTVATILQTTLDRLSPEDRQRVLVDSTGADLRSSLRLPSSGLEEALLVMLRNALSSTRGQETVALHVDLQHQQVCFIVRDQGPGFSSKMLQHWGEPFRTERPEGMGLGLFFVRRLAAAQGGLVTVSNQTGGGAVVTLKLPVSPFS